MIRKILVFDNTMESMLLLLNMIESPEKFVMEEVEELYLFRVSYGYLHSFPENIAGLDHYNKIMDWVGERYDIPFKITPLMNHEVVRLFVNKQIRPGMALYEQIIRLLEPILQDNDDIYYGSLLNPNFPMIDSMRPIVGEKHIWITFPFNGALRDMKEYMEREFKRDEYKDLIPLLKRQPNPSNIVLQEL